MNELISRPFILHVLSIISIVISVMLITEIPAELDSKSSSDKTKNNRISTDIFFKTIDMALKENIQQNFFTYSGEFDNPFRFSGTDNEQAADNQTAQTQTTELPKLQLKGILSKDRPLAILENYTGATFIRGVGDSVGDDVISAISGNKVTITQKKGKYDIVVKEE